MCWASFFNPDSSTFSEVRTHKDVGQKDVGPGVDQGGVDQAEAAEEYVCQGPLQSYWGFTHILGSKCSTLNGMNMKASNASLFGVCVHACSFGLHLVVGCMKGESLT